MGNFPCPSFFLEMTMYEYRSKVVKVVDGDTIDVDIDLGFDVVLSKQRIRLYGIDTPECRTRDENEKFYGKLSADFLKKYCRKGSYIILRTHLDKKGKFGRILGEIIVDDVNINQLMVKENMAVEYHGQSKTIIEKEHLSNRSILVRKGHHYLNPKG